MKKWFRKKSSFGDKGPKNSPPNELPPRTEGLHTYFCSYCGGYIQYQKDDKDTHMAKRHPDVKKLS